MKREFGWITEECAYENCGYEKATNIDDFADATFCDSFEKAEEQAKEASEDTEGGYVIYELCDGELVKVYDFTKFDDLYEWEDDSFAGQHWWDFRQQKVDEMTEYFENGPEANSDALIEMGVAKYEDGDLIDAEGNLIDWEQLAEAFVGCAMDGLAANDVKRLSEAERVYDELTTGLFDDYFAEAASNLCTFEGHRKMYGWAGRKELEEFWNRE